MKNDNDIDSKGDESEDEVELDARSMKEFDAKKDSVFRTYEYYLPTFTLQNCKVPCDVLQDDIKSHQEETKNPYSINRVRIKILENDGDMSLANLYSYRINEKTKEKLTKMLQKYKGTKEFHNYTKQKKRLEGNMGQRYISQIGVKEFTMVRGIEFARIYIKGQSFLYHQIRKMIGALFMVMQHGAPESYIDESFIMKDMNIPTAPGEGLLLHHVGYNWKKSRVRQKPMPIPVWEEKLEDVELFRRGLLDQISNDERSNYCFTHWMAWMDRVKSAFMLYDKDPLVKDEPKRKRYSTEISDGNDRRNEHI